MTNSTDWGKRSYQDKPDATSWGGQNVFAGDTLRVPGAAAGNPGPGPAPAPPAAPPGDAPPVSGNVPTYSPYTVYSTGHQAAFAVSDASQMQPHHDYQTVSRDGQQLEVRDIVLHRAGQSQTRSSTATHSTWCVIGNNAYASSDPST